MSGGLVIWVYQSRRRVLYGYALAGPIKGSPFAVPAPSGIGEWSVKRRVLVLLAMSVMGVLVLFAPAAAHAQTSSCYPPGQSCSSASASAVSQTSATVEQGTTIPRTGSNSTVPL